MSKPLTAFGMASAASGALAASVFSVALIAAGIALEQPNETAASEIDYNALQAYEPVVMSEAELEAKYGALNTEALHESKEFIRRLAHRLRARMHAVQNFRRSYTPCSAYRPFARVPLPSVQPLRQPQPSLVVSGGLSNGGADASDPNSCPGGVCPPTAEPLEAVPDAVIQSTK